MGNAFLGKGKLDAVFGKIGSADAVRDPGVGPIPAQRADRRVPRGRLGGQVQGNRLRLQRQAPVGQLVQQGLRILIGLAPGHGFPSVSVDRI